MVRLASLMRSAIRRRRPITLISDVSGDVSAETPAPAGRAAGRETAEASAADGFADEWGRAAIRSPRKIRPPGPDPAIVDKSIPASCARRRFAGDAMTRPWRAAGICAAPGAGTAARTGAAAIFAATAA